jgi:hypothetical protein
MPPIEALRAWMLLFVDDIAAKQIIAPTLNTVVGGASKLYEGSCGQIQGATDAPVKRAIKSGDIRRDLDPFDLLRALIGVAHVASGSDWQQSAKRLVHILITGSRPAKWARGSQSRMTRGPEVERPEADISVVISGSRSFARHLRLLDRHCSLSTSSRTAVNACRRHRTRPRGHRQAP